MFGKPLPDPVTRPGYHLSIVILRPTSAAPALRQLILRAGPFDIVSSRRPDTSSDGTVTGSITGAIRRSTQDFVRSKVHLSRYANRKAADIENTDLPPLRASYSLLWCGQLRATLRGRYSNCKIQGRRIQSRATSL